MTYLWKNQRSLSTIRGSMAQFSEKGADLPPPPIPHGSNRVNDSDTDTHSVSLVVIQTPKRINVHLICKKNYPKMSPCCWCSLFPYLCCNIHPLPILNASSCNGIPRPLVSHANANWSTPYLEKACTRGYCMIDWLIVLVYIENETQRSARHTQCTFLALIFFYNFARGYIPPFRSHTQKLQGEAVQCVFC